MQTWLTKLLTGIIVTWGRDLVGFLVGLFSKYMFKKKTEEINDSQADRVQKLANEIRQLEKEGKPVPQELKDAYENESARLINSGI